VKATPPQGRRLIALLKRRPMTTMQLLATGISVCPWKRCAECLHDGEQLIHSKRSDGLNVYRVVSASKWTA
jgi:hypothetical protein